MRAPFGSMFSISCNLHARRVRVIRCLRTSLSVSRMARCVEERGEKLDPPVRPSFLTVPVAFATVMPQRGGSLRDGRGPVWPGRDGERAAGLHDPSFALND